MSMPNIPDINPDICLCFEDVINLLLSSVALQEIALSNVINAESEKLQTVLKMKEKCYSVKELICLNESIEKVLCEVGAIETLLITKLKHINNIYNKKDKNCECQNSNECPDDCKKEMNYDFNNICNKYIEEFNSKYDECDCECDTKYKENDKMQNHEFKNKSEPYKDLTNNSNKNSTYNKNEYYQNYNKVTDMFNKILGRGGNKIT